MSPKPRRQTPKAEVPAEDGERPGPDREGWEPFARFPLRRLGPEWFGPNWLTNTNWFGHWDDLFPTRWPAQFPGGARPDTFRIEEFEEGDDVHVIRAEMPGLDPESDINIEVEDDTLCIAATRQEKTETRGEVFHSEFSYGTFRRRVRLPSGATADDVTASYEAGVLEIRITRRRDKTDVVSIPVRPR